MRHWILIAGLACSLSAAAADAPRATAFGWMAGCWGYERGGSRYEEHWLSPTGNNMPGLSRRVADGFTKEFEFLRIVTTGTGFDYISQPKGEAEKRYGMTRQESRLVSFETLDGEDFPATITYEFVPPDSLTERLEGHSGDKPVKLTFPMHRVDCTIP